jgi:O-antigen/teichoic acid export membrane protein
LVASIITVIYNNLYTIVIGKKFNSRDLGYYSRADQFAVFPSNIGGIISNVAFPTLSKIQSCDDKLEYAYRKIIRYSSFVIFPLMIGVASVAEPFIISLLGEKWRGSVPFLQILPFALMWDHLSSLNLNLLYVKGKTDLVLKLEILKKAIAVIILFTSIPFGIIVMCLGRVLYGILAFYINTSYTKKLIGLSFFQQVYDFLPYLILSLIMGGIVFTLVSVIPVSSILALIIGVFIGGFIYMALSLLLFKEIREEIFVLVGRMKSN